MKCLGCGKEIDDSHVWGHCPECLKKLNEELFRNPRNNENLLLNEENHFLGVVTYIIGGICFIFSLFYLFATGSGMSEGTAVFLYLSTLPMIVLAGFNIILCIAAIRNSKFAGGFFLPIIPSLLLIILIAVAFLNGS
jgi:hypothetical protein